MLGHDALLDDVDELLFDCVVAHQRTPEQIAAVLPVRLADTLAAATPADWQRHTDRLIADIHDIDTNDSSSPTTRKDRSR